MRKELLIRHILGECSSADSLQVLDWIKKSPANEKYYISLLNLYAIESLVDGSPISLVDENEKEKCRNAILKPHKFHHNFLKIASSAAAIIILMMSVLLNVYQYYHRKPLSLVSDVVPDKSDIQLVYYTNSGVKGKIMLPDSSVVWLNSCSKISFPQHFSSNERNVSFEGEGYFEVAKNAEWPMLVSTPKGMKIKVVGTKFMVKAYDNDNFEQATLFTGKILVSNNSNPEIKNGKETELFPGESIRYSTKIQPVRSFNVDTVKTSAWKRGELLFEQTPITEVCKTLERWHGVKIVLDDKSLLNYNFTADFGSESITQIMELVKFTMPINYRIDSNTVYISHK